MQSFSSGESMKILKQTDFDPQDRGADSNANAAERIGFLLDWFDSSQKVQIEVVSSEFNFLDTLYSHYLVTLSEGSRLYIGHGRAKDPEIALLKGLHEAIERYVMSEFFRTYPAGNGGIQINMGTDGQYEESSFSSIFAPGPRMHNSNGWAVDANPNTALRRAFYEALERHWMQLNYLTQGMAFLKTEKTFEYDDFRFELSRVPLGQNLEVLVTSVFNRRFSGRMFGHACSHLGSGLDAFDHPMIEAYQIAKSALENREVAEDVFDRIQLSFLKSGDFFQPASPRIVSCPDNFSLNVVGIDIGRSYGLRTSLYAVWVYSDDILPLYLAQQVSHTDAAIFQKQLDHILGAGTILRQTPFI